MTFSIDTRNLPLPPVHCGSNRFSSSSPFNSAVFLLSLCRRHFLSPISSFYIPFPFAVDHDRSSERRVTTHSFVTPLQTLHFSLICSERHFLVGPTNLRHDPLTSRVSAQDEIPLLHLDVLLDGLPLLSVGFPYDSSWINFRFYFFPPLLPFPVPCRIDSSSIDSLSPPPPVSLPFVEFQDCFFPPVQTLP